MILRPIAQAVPSKRMVTVRATETKDSVDVDKLVSDLQAKVVLSLLVWLVDDGQIWGLFSQ